MENNPVDAIIEIFISAGWKFTESPNPYYSKYLLPDVVLSSSRSKYEGIEAMGLYRPKDLDWKIEGEIVLYYNTILSVAEDYCSQSNDNNVDNVVSYLTEIVYVHECVHWIMHWIESPTYGMTSCLNNKFIPVEYDYSRMETIEFHEAFAQLFTLFYLEWHVDKKRIFDWLIISQPYQYRKFEELLNWSIRSGYEAVKLLSLLRLFNYQTFTDINKWILFSKKVELNSFFVDSISGRELLRILSDLPISDNVYMICILNLLFDGKNMNKYAETLFKGLTEDEINELSKSVAIMIGGEAGEAEFDWEDVD